jgi:hypothetical protein
MNPAALLPGLGPDLVQRLPEAQGPIAGGELGIEHKTVLVTQPDQQLKPALGTLAVAVLKGQELLAATCVGADEDEDALPVVIEPRGEVNPVRPEIDPRVGRRPPEGRLRGGRRDRARTSPDAPPARSRSGAARSPPRGRGHPPQAAPSRLR